MHFKSNAQRRAVMSQMNGDRKAETMMTIKQRWAKRNEQKFKEGTINRDKYIEENKRINGGEYDEFVEHEADFIVKNDIQLPPLPNGDKNNDK